MDAPRKDKLVARWDKREGLKPEECVDLGDIGEDLEGVWVRRHVLAMVDDEPMVEAWFAAWSMVSDRAVRIEHHDTLCAWWCSASMIAAAAVGREQVRRMAPGGQ